VCCATERVAPGFSVSGVVWCQDKLARGGGDRGRIPAVLYSSSVFKMRMIAPMLSLVKPLGFSVLAGINDSSNACYF